MPLPLRNRPLVNERDYTLVYASPNIGDILLYEFRDSTLPKNQDPEYGVTTPIYGDWPNHKLCFIAPADEKGKQKWYYAADRENQDLYNFSTTKADIGGTKFDAVSRTYLIPRASFTPDTPAMGTSMPNVPAGLFTGQFVLAERQQRPSDVQELNSLYVMEVRTYVRKVSLGEIGYDEDTGRSTWSFITLYYSGEVVTGGSTIDTLYADTDNSYWGLQTTGVFRTVERISEKWFAVKSLSVLPESPINASGNPAKARIINRTTPLGTDVYFTETGAMPSPVPGYGSTHYSFTNHKLSLITPADKSGLLYTFHYVADRSNQDDYNWEINEGKELIRTYVVPRSTYPSVPTVPEAAAQDTQFTAYGFADDTVVPAPEELRSLYVVVRRRFIEPVTEDYNYSAEFERAVKITKEVIATDADQPPVSAPGSIVEVQHVNSYHDVKITQELVLGEGEAFPLQLVTIPSTYNFNFPRKLMSVELKWANAWAYATGQQPSYSEDYYFSFDLEDARPGPYEASVLRFVTDDPEAVKALYPITLIPQPKTESIGVVGSWWHASSETGNSTFATAKEYVTPAAIHDELTIDLNNFLPNGTEGLMVNDLQGYTETLPATPGAVDFFTITDATTPETGTITIDYDVKRLPLGLYEVSVIQIDIRNLYSA